MATVLAGAIHDLPVSALLNTVYQQQLSGRLFIWCANSWAALWCYEGRMVHALVLDRTNQLPIHAGEEAILYVRSWEDGAFYMAASDQQVASHYLRTIARPVEALIDTELYCQLA